MSEILIKLFLFITVFDLILCSQTTSSPQNSSDSSKLIEDIYVSCDQKTAKQQNSRKDPINRENLCKVECYTKQKNPGFCRIHALDPCKTLNPEQEQVKCQQYSGHSSMFQSICCPFKSETNPSEGTAVQKPLKPIPTTTTTGAPEQNIKPTVNCGKRPDIAAIVGGINAQPNTWPWVVSVYERANPRAAPRFICGGAIINERYILSAAHCFVRSDGQKVRANQFVVKVGGHRLSDRNIPFLEIQDIFVHKNYQTVQHYNDIALMKVKTRIEFLPTVGPICLPKGRAFLRETFVGRPSKLIGWGATRFGGSTSDSLREVDVPIVDNQDCYRNYSRIPGLTSAFPKGIDRSLMCAGVTTGGKDSCQGDSGGPLALEVDGRWYELGIVSFGYKCAEPGFPGIYV